MINARSETAHTKPAFRDALKSRRCLIPADGFYEWQGTGKARQPFCFEVNEDRNVSACKVGEGQAAEEGCVGSSRVLWVSLEAAFVLFSAVLEQLWAANHRSAYICCSSSGTSEIGC
jgi:hypothetical protein